jgi:hypothetical protein
MVGLHATYDRLIENSRMDRLYVNARFANASPMGILLPFALRDQIAHVEGVSAVGAVSDLRGYYQEPQQRVSIYAVDEHMRKAWPELPLTAVQWDQLLTTPTGVFISLLRAKTTQARDGPCSLGVRSPDCTRPGLGRGAGRSGRRATRHTRCPRFGQRRTGDLT